MSLLNMFGKHGPKGKNSDSIIKQENDNLKLTDEEKNSDVKQSPQTKNDSETIVSDFPTGKGEQSIEAIHEVSKSGEGNTNTDCSSHTVITGSGVVLCANEGILPKEEDAKEQGGSLATSDISVSSDEEYEGKTCYSEKNKRYVIGDIAGTFYQIPFSAEKSDEDSFRRNDIVADIANIGGLLVMGASLRGESHYAHRIPRQDSFLIEECAISENQKFVIACIADGVGNAKKADEFSEMLVNVLSSELAMELHKTADLTKIEWDELAERIWRISVHYCFRKSGSKDFDEYFSNWASTLECVVVEAKPLRKSRFVGVTISGDGGLYKIDSSHRWFPIKHGKTRNSSFVSNLVYCLPDKPERVIVNRGVLENGEALLMVTDGLGDYIEEYSDVRQFFGEKLPSYNNLPEFIRVLNVAVKQMDDDKTGVLISYYDKAKL